MERLKLFDKEGNEVKPEDAVIAFIEDRAKLYGIGTNEIVLSMYYGALHVDRPRYSLTGSQYDSLERIRISEMVE